MGAYKKFLGMLMATALAAVAPAVADGHWSGAEILNAAILLCGTGTVLGAANLPAGAWRYAKTIFALGTAVLVVVAAAITDGMFTADEIIQCVLAGLAALGVVPWVNNTGSAPNGASTEATGMPPGTDTGLVTAGALA